MSILSGIHAIRASVRGALILPMVTVFVVLGGCASPNKYRPAEVVAMGKSYAHLSSGYTENEIFRTIDYPGRQSSDKIYFITYGHQPSGVSRG